MYHFDCHAHVFEANKAVPNARYVPDVPANLLTWLENLERHKLKGGVLVQVSFLGTDNSQLCAALEKVDRKYFAGVAVVPLDVEGAELDRLVRSGIAGVRWNLVRGANIPDINATATQSFFDNLRARDLHLEIHLEGPRLAPVLPHLTDQGIKLVVDHFGLPSEPQPKSDPMVRAVGALQDRSNLFFKFSAPYRTSFDLRFHAGTLLAHVGEDHVVWGSDWPHTQHRNIKYDDVASSTEEGLALPQSNDAAKALFGLHTAN